MNARLPAVFVIATALALACVWKFAPERGPSCEERGGRRVFAGFVTINNMVGKVMVPTLVPQYRCENPQ